MENGRASRPSLVWRNSTGPGDPIAVATAKRARQLKDGAVPLVKCSTKHPVTVALHEIAAGKVVVKPLGEVGGEIRGHVLHDDYRCGQIGRKPRNDLSESLRPSCTRSDADHAFGPRFARRPDLRLEIEFNRRETHLFSIDCRGELDL